MAAFLLHYTLKYWKHIQKLKYRYSELADVILLIIMGYYQLHLFSNPTINNIALIRAFSLFSIGLIVFFLGFNVFPVYIRCKLNPNFRKDETYEKFLTSLSEKSNNNSKRSSERKKRIIRNSTRKLLHLLQFTVYVLIGVLVSQDRFQSTFLLWNILPVEFRNYLLFFIAQFFWVMMLIGDLTRLRNWRYLPKWGHIWYKYSLEPEREAWTINASITILLSNFVWLLPSIPFSVFLVAAWVSCIADAMASIIGGHFGKHKLPKWTPHPEKSFEGLVAGALTAFFGVFLVFSIILPGFLPFILQILLALIIGCIFSLIDAFGKIFGDNLLNSLLSGAAVLLFLKIF
ncbi:MAG: hypothetical protein ACTSVU_06965 [Promethearchaeota archaeon]